MKSRTIHALMDRPEKRFHIGIRTQLYFTCITMLALIVFVGVSLGTVSYESIQRYHTSMQTVADVYSLRSQINVWDVSMEEYVLNTAAFTKDNCMAQWEQIGQQLQNFCTGSREAEVLALSNLQSLYQHGQKEMDAALSTDNNTEKMEHYRALTHQRDGLLFLCDQLLQNNMEYEVQSYPQIVERSLRSVKILIMVLVASFLLMIGWSIRVVHAVYRPINLLVQDARQIGAGNYDTPAVEIINDDELGYLSQAFNDMKKAVADNFRSLQRIMELQKLLQNVELKALQAQINPHFLFNVLSVAEEAALRENAGQTVEIVENISYMLQYSLKSTKQDTTLAEELRTVRAYLFLQEKRFGDRISFVFSAPGALPTLLIPGMSLQPIVENAIRHGVEKMEQDGWVHVQVRERISYIEVTVSDNGYGIEPALLEAIRKQELDSSKNGIGLINTTQRMEMFYQQTGLLKIDSLIGQGTTVTLRYPLSTKEDIHVQVVGGG